MSIVGLLVGSGDNESLKSTNESVADLGLCAVTGSSGWLASCLISKLTQNGYKVRCLDIVEPSTKEQEQPLFPINQELIEFHRCDITSSSEVLKALDSVNTLFHLCAVTDIRWCPSDALYQVNVMGTATLLQACKKQNVQRFIHTSSMDAVVHESTMDQRTEIQCQPALRGIPYAQSKAMAEQLVLTAGHQIEHPLSVSILRPCHIYGPGTPIINVFSEFPIRIGDERCNHSLIYIENCAFAHVKVAQALAANPKQCDGEAFFVRDHDYNLCQWYRKVLCEDDTIPFLYIPAFIMRMFAHLHDAVVHELFAIFGLRFGHPVQTIGLYSINATSQERTFSAEKLKKLMGCNFPVETEEAVRRTRKWRKSAFPEML